MEVLTETSPRRHVGEEENPGDGFATGCTSYANMQNCIGALGEGPDFMFTVMGEAS